MTKPNRCNIGIVGSGPSAVYLLKALVASSDPLSITIFEAGRQPGVGTPYNPETTAGELLANIASVELPPVLETLEAWLLRQSDGVLKVLGVARGAVTERSFHPRIALGAYFNDQFQQLLSRGRKGGHRIVVHRRNRVVDIIPGPAKVVAVALSSGGRLRRSTFSRVVIATGHDAPRQPPLDYLKLASRLVARNAGDGPFRVGVLGTSLSAIDVVVATAAAAGRFKEDAGRLIYEPVAAAGRMTMCMMSRNGILPEADFYCPIPHQPMSHFTPAAMHEMTGKVRQSNLLDEAFDLFRRQLETEDPAYADRIDLVHLTADSFAKAYFADRLASDPFEWARQNLAETRANLARCHTVRWRYAILRMHEVIALILPRLSEQDLTRFNEGLKRVFVDCYAAVPPQSIERLLALHEAGVLSILRLGGDHSIAGADSNGEWEGSGRVHVSVAGKTYEYDAIVDATGRVEASQDTFPFPSLRLAMLANRMPLPCDDEAEADLVGPAFEMLGRLNALERIHCLAIPFLIRRRPFMQGLTSSADMGAAVAAAILKSHDGVTRDEPAYLRQLARDVLATEPLFNLDSRTVVVAPRKKRPLAHSPQRMKSRQHVPIR